MWSPVCKLHISPDNRRSWAQTQEVQLYFINITLNTAYILTIFSRHIVQY